MNLNLNNFSEVTTAISNHIDAFNYNNIDINDSNPNHVVINVRHMSQECSFERTNDYITWTGNKNAIHFIKQFLLSVTYKRPVLLSLQH